ncbi:NAD_binding_10 domain-containing protein [Cephalotus follicularis]|uniref:NAD_binding_10 domain-containing protein n=1 Tax=Cephalotus follicularis TaxID=3775 RepID=A0A1Q3BQR9_CEPFO|nr:NAD_binding_10 domain-containing protein [Cephalotus follicularis]
MASKLSFIPGIADIPLPLVKFPKHPQTLSLFPLELSSGYASFKSVSSSFAMGKSSSSSSSSVVHAVQEDVVQSPSSDSPNTPPASSKLVLVVGGTGGVGQLIVASLLSRNIKSRLLLRDPEKAATLFGIQDDEDTLKVFKGDTRNPEDLDPSIFEGVTHVICCTGTTAFPSKRWDGDNTPERVDWEGVRNLVSALPSSLKRLILVSSVGVTKSNELPWSIMNLFGVLKYKKMGEDFVRKSGLPFTIIRPGRLTDGPYTSYDLNTLLQATAGQRRAVLIGQGDKLVGEVSRLVVAEACIQALDIEFTEGKTYEINSVEGDGPGSDQQKWRELFKAVQAV